MLPSASPAPAPPAPHGATWLIFSSKFVSAIRMPRHHVVCAPSALCQTDGPLVTRLQGGGSQNHHTSLFLTVLPPSTPPRLPACLRRRTRRNRRRAYTPNTTNTKTPSPCDRCPVSCKTGPRGERDGASRCSVRLISPAIDPPPPVLSIGSTARQYNFVLLALSPAPTHPLTHPPTRSPPVPSAALLASTTHPAAPITSLCDICYRPDHPPSLPLRCRPMHRVRASRARNKVDGRAPLTTQTSAQLIKKQGYFKREKKESLAIQRAGSEAVTYVGAFSICLPWSPDGRASPAHPSPGGHVQAQNHNHTS